MGFEGDRFGFQEKSAPEASFDPEVLVRTTINRALRAAEAKYGHNRFVFVDEVTDEEGNLDSIILLDPQQAVDSSHPRKLVRMRKNANGMWESDEFVPADAA